MKDLYLLILKEYKKWVITVILAITIFGVGLQIWFGVLSIAMVFLTTLNLYICIDTWCNGMYPYLEPINEQSNKFDVFARWLTILGLSVFHIWVLVIPFFEK
ncbi:hypothetical protein [Acinetobacter populi]|nr:hypothetical protein [Acinetobacter populi]